MGYVVSLTGEAALIDSHVCFSTACMLQSQDLLHETPDFALNNFIPLPSSHSLISHGLS